MWYVRIEPETLWLESKCCTHTQLRYTHTHTLKVHSLVVRELHLQLKDYGFNSQIKQYIVILSKTLHFMLLCCHFDIWRVVHRSPEIWQRIRANVHTAQTVDYYEQIICTSFSVRNCGTLMRCVEQKGPSYFKAKGTVIHLEIWGPTNFFFKQVFDNYDDCILISLWPTCGAQGPISALLCKNILEVSKCPGISICWEILALLTHKASGSQRFTRFWNSW